MEGAVEGGIDDWGEVVTRYPYGNVGMDHLLSKEKVQKRKTILVQFWKNEDSFRSIFENRITEDMRKT